MNELPSGLVTREALMLAAGFDAAKDLRRARRRTLQALNAETPRVTIYGKEGDVLREIESGPDHDIRLRAAGQVYAWHGLREQRATVQATFTGPIQITWTPPARSASSPPSLTNGTSTNSSNGSTSASATGDSGKPSWL